MIKNGQYQYDLTEKLSFLRYGGTADELRAAEILKGEIESFGGQCSFMEFTIPAYSVTKCSLTVTAPFERKIDAYAYGLSGSLPEGGVELELYYAGRGVEEDYYGVKDLSHKIVLLEELNFDNYKILCQKKAAAFITTFAKWHDEDPDIAFLVRPLRPKFLENGKVPGVSISSRDATDLLRDGGAKVRLELVQEEFLNTSRNVIAEVPGTQFPEEVIVITAHYDSVLVGTGSWDNATGSATIMYLYEHFLKNPAKRTLRFIWCGSEEQGLCGSKAYVEQNPDAIPNIKFCFNFDMCGTVLGSNSIVVTGGDDLKHYAEQFCRELGVSARIDVHVHSSDSAPFADKGIPALGISRGTRSADIHTRHDLMFPLSADALAITGDLAEKFISKTANAVCLPVSTGMPDNVKTMLDKYFSRDKIPYKPEEAEKTKETTEE